MSGREMDFKISTGSVNVLDTWKTSFGNMGNTKSAQENEPEANNTKETPSHSQGFGHFYSTEIAQIRRCSCISCCKNILKIIFYIIGLLTAIQSLVVTTVTVGSTIATKLYNKEQSSRLVAMIFIAVTAAVAISMVTYSMVAVYKKRRKPIHATAAVMVILAIIQAVILGVSLKVTVEDEILLNRSLVDSFRLAREDNPRHVKLWATTQSDLNCCGVYSAEDYRQLNVPSYFAPNVPISCCPGFDPNRSELAQERERESCKARHEFFEAGCKAPILEMFKFTNILVMANTILLIFCELILATTSVVLLRQQIKKEEVTAVEAPTPMPRASLSLAKKSIS